MNIRKKKKRGIGKERSKKYEKQKAERRIMEVAEMEGIRENKEVKLNNELGKRIREEKGTKLSRFRKMMLKKRKEDEAEEI